MRKAGGEEAETEVIVVYLVGEVPRAVAVGTGGDRLDEELVGAHDVLALEETSFTSMPMTRFDGMPMASVSARQMKRSEPLTT